MSAQQLMDKRGLWMSATWRTILLAIALPVAQVRDRHTAGDLVLNAFVGTLRRHDRNAIAHAGRHDGRTCAAVECHFYHHPFIGCSDAADANPFLLRQQTDLLTRPVKVAQHKDRRKFRSVWVPVRVLNENQFGHLSRT